MLGEKEGIEGVKSLMIDRLGLVRVFFRARPFTRRRPHYHVAGLGPVLERSGVLPSGESPPPTWSLIFCCSGACSSLVSLHFFCCSCIYYATGGIRVQPLLMSKELREGDELRIAEAETFVDSLLASYVGLRRRQNP